jgi:O-antigen/teichoic acid export membrane protein
MARNARPSGLVSLAVVGQGIGYGLAILVARTLDVQGFEAYVIASSLFILLATSAPLGLEKYALKALPPLLDSGQAAQARGFLRVAFRRTLGTALLASLGLAGWALLNPNLDATVRAAVLVACASVPAGALVHLALDALTGAGEPRRALAIFRVGVPSLVLMLVAGLGLSGVALSGAMAVGAWGLAWCVALGLMGVHLAKALGPEVRNATADAAEAGRWRREARPFFLYRLAMTLLAQAGILALDAADVAPGVVGAYAAAAGTAGLVVVLATATNRAYARELGLLIARGDAAGIMAVRKARLAWLAPMVGLFLLVALLFPEALLSLFRPEFAEPGAWPLRLLAIAHAFTVLFALAPTYLKYMKRNRLTYAGVLVAAAVHLALLALLVPPLGATGAALAYLVSMGGLYAVFALLAARDVKGLAGP